MRPALAAVLLLACAAPRYPSPGSARDLPLQRYRQEVSEATEPSLDRDALNEQSRHPLAAPAPASEVPGTSSKVPGTSSKVPGTSSKVPGTSVKTVGTQVGAAVVERAPMLVYTANLEMAAFEVPAALKAAEAVGKESGGFMTQRTNTSIVIRVPVARFEEAMGRLEKLGDVIGRHVTAEDVTAEYFDVEVRLRSARAVRDRLEQLLARATKVDDSIAIERELERVVGEIERLEGRLKFLKDRAQYSTITLTFAPREREKVAKDSFTLPFPWLDELGLGRLLRLR